MRARPMPASQDPVEYPSQCFNLRMTFVTLFKVAWRAAIACTCTS